MKELARRDFLKLSGLGLASLITPNFQVGSASKAYQFDPFDGQQGRVTSTSIWTYDRPSFEGARIKQYWRDLLLPITHATTGEDSTAYNPVWYVIGEEGFAYSGSLQPVRTILNEPSLNIPAGGLLAEVSVPFTDAHESPDESSKTVYRLYYESTHWVTAADIDLEDSKVWYKIWDDKLGKRYFARAAHLRLLTNEELQPIAVEIPEKEKHIEVQLSNQLVVAYERNAPVFTTRAATGAVFRSGTYTTPSGTFQTYHKRSTRHMAAGDLAASGFNLTGVPWVMYITEKGISFHGTFWHNDFGKPRSHGCINLTPQAAKWLFRWSSPRVNPDEIFAYERTGTRVVITV